MTESVNSYDRPLLWTRVMWTFSLLLPAISDGYIVQKITMRTYIAPCGGASRPVRLTYWEAWDIADGATMPASVSSPPLPPGAPPAPPITAWYTDMDMEWHPVATWGSHVSLGEIKFFTRDDIGEIQESGFEHGNVIYAGNLLSTTHQPTWWSRPSSQGETTATRIASSNWSCCCGSAFQNSPGFYYFRP